MSRQHLDPGRTTWHITFGTHGARLHGDDRPTVDREHNERDTPFLPPDPQRIADEQAHMRDDEVRLTAAQRAVVESALPAICARGKWTYRIAAAPPPPEDHHVHVLLDADSAVHGKDIRKWLKRWLSEALSRQFAVRRQWWAEAGSTKPVKDEAYLNNVFNYILRQRTTPFVQMGDERR
jgi:REP element-mobilizing transposase RayT